MTNLIQKPDCPDLPTVRASIQITRLYHLDVPTPSATNRDDVIDYLYGLSVDEIEEKGEHESTDVHDARILNAPWDEDEDGEWDE